MFDIDGTLTKSRTKMTNDFTLSFLSWMTGKDIYLITGSDIDKVSEQTPRSVLMRCKGVFASMANELYVNDKLVYSNKFKLPDYIYKWLNGRLCSSQCPDDLRGITHYEERPGMLNFSICGRDVTLEQRKKYNEWDSKLGERKQIVEQFNDTYNSDGYEACLGGEISIDIQPIGKDKSQGVKYLQEQGYNSISYYGDRCVPGGNDWGACEYIIENNLGVWYHVKSPYETLALLNNISKI